MATTRARDAKQTRSELLEAARVRFARDGYRSTTVRDIATDAGVNVSLINRYFESKEKLFEQCIARVGEELDTPQPGSRTVEGMAARIAAQIVGLSSAQMILLLRTSGDPGADAIRRSILRSFAEKMAGVAGWTPESGGDDLLLRSEIVMGAILGIMQLRITSGLEPISAATEEELVEPLRELLVALLAR